MNIIARLEYELAYYDSAVLRFNYYTTRTPPKVGGVRWKTYKWKIVKYIKVKSIKCSFIVHQFFPTLISPVISTNIHYYLNNTFHEFKALKKVIKTKTYNIDFHNKFIKFGLFCFFYFLHKYVCVCVCVCVCTLTYLLDWWKYTDNFKRVDTSLSKDLVHEN